MTSLVEQVTEVRRGNGRLVHYLAAALLARTADEGARVALVILALDRAGSAAVGGTLVATLLIPHVVAAPLVGTLVDRSRRPAAVLGGAFAVLGGGLAASVALLGHAPLWSTYLVLAVAGCCGPAVSGGLTSRLAALTGPGHEARAFGLDSLFYNVAGVAGPAAVGLIAAVAGPGAAALSLAVSAGLGAVCVATLHLPASDAAAREARTAGVFAGAAAIARDPALRALTLTTGFSQLGAGGLAVVATTLAVAAHAPVHSSILTAGLFGLSGFFTGPFAAALFLARDQLSTGTIRTQVFTIGAGLKTAAAALGAGLLGFAAHLPAGAQLLLVAAPPIIAGLAARLLLRRR